MHKSQPRLIRPRIIEVVKNGNENVQDVGGFEYVKEELLVGVTHLPKQHQQLLIEVNALART